MNSFAIDMEIVKYPNSILNKMLEPVLVFDEKLGELLANMRVTMLQSRGIGLAANQVGLDMSMFIMKTQSGEFLEIINPFIIGFSDNKANLTEGCLSAPGVFDVLDRHEEVEVEYQERTGKAVRRKFTGLDAVCVQHEYDHLQGIFFFSKMKLNRQRRRAIERKWGKV